MCSHNQMIIIEAEGFESGKGFIRIRPSEKKLLKSHQPILKSCPSAFEKIYVIQIGTKF